MEKEKNKNGIVALLVVLVIILAVLCVFLATGTISLKEKAVDSKTTDNQQTNEITEGNANTGTVDERIVVNNNADDQSIVNNTTNVIFRNKDEITFDDITVKVENGNIKFTSGSKEKIFTSVNVKYIYLAPFMDSANTTLYYITNNNELYCKNLFPFASNVFFDKETTSYGVKILENVEGFIGEMSASKYNSEGKAVELYKMVNILLSDKITIAVTCSE